MANFTMTREKNMVYFQPETSNKAYGFDINTGVFYGLKGAPIKTAPAGFFDFLSQEYENGTADFILRFMYEVHTGNAYRVVQDYSPRRINDMSRYANRFNLLDKLQNIGYTGLANYRAFCIDDLDFLDKKQNFKAFAKALKENNRLTIVEYRNQYEADMFKKALGSIADNPHFTDNMAKYVKEYLYEEKVFSNNSKLTEEELSCAVYYLIHGLWDFHYNAFHLDRDDETNYTHSYNYEITGKLVDFFTYCRALHIQPKKDNFFKQAIEVGGMYKLNKARIDNEKIQSAYAEVKTKLLYENDEYQIVIPENTEDFRAEADAQHNCVYRLYMKEVTAGHTYVVFVRKKDAPENSYITCEVNKSGYIQQYLLRYNQRPIDSNDTAFKKEYQNWLNKQF